MRRTHCKEQASWIHLVSDLNLSWNEYGMDDRIGREQ
jgi:hypothetical protein